MHHFLNYFHCHCLGKEHHLQYFLLKTARSCWCMKSFLDFIQLSLFYIDPIARSGRRVRASTSKPGRKGPIIERDTRGPFPFPEKPNMILFPVFFTHFYKHSQNNKKFILSEDYRSHQIQSIIHNSPG